MSCSARIRATTTWVYTSMSAGENPLARKQSRICSADNRPRRSPIQRASAMGMRFDDALHARPRAVVGQMHDEGKEGPALHDEIDVRGRDLGDEPRLRVVLRDALAAGDDVARAPECGAQIGDSVLRSAVGGVGHAIVDVLQIPVVDERHHHPEAVELARADEGIVVPAPRGRFFAASAAGAPDAPRHDASPVTNSCPRASRGNPTTRIPGAVVVLIDHVTGSPEQACGGRFRLRLFSEFDLPPDTVFVFDLELRRRAAVGFLDESEGRCRAREPFLLARPPGPARRHRRDRARSQPCSWPAERRRGPRDTARELSAQHGCRFASGVCSCL